MENVLDLYQRPEATAYPLVCVDETSKQHIKETRHPLAMACGIPSRYDSEYQRNGVSNLFMIFAPLLGFRHVIEAYQKGVWSRRKSTVSSPQRSVEASLHR